MCDNCVTTSAISQSLKTCYLLLANGFVAFDGISACFMYLPPYNVGVIYALLTLDNLSVTAQCVS